MRPRILLILVALAALVLPWAGWQLVRQLETLLREGQEQAQIAAAQAIARAAAASLPDLPPAETALFVHTARAPILIDGSGDDWGEYEGTRSVDGALMLALAEDSQSLYALLEVRDATRARADVGNPVGLSGDRFTLTLRDTFGLRAWQFGNAAPGSVQVSGAAGGPVGEWQETPDGYRVELRLPRAMPPAAIALVVEDVAAGSVTPTRKLLSTTDDPLPLIGDNRMSDRVLAQLVPDGARLRIVSTDGWVVGQAGALTAPSRTAEERGGQFRGLLYRLLLAPPAEASAAYAPDLERLNTPLVFQALSGLPASTARASGAAGSVILAAAVPLQRGGETHGAVLLEQPGEALLVTANRAVFGVLAASLLAVLFGVLIVLSYSGLLSLRIRRLRNAAERALRPDGRIEPNFPLLGAQDDLGDLSRSFARLLGEIGAYTDYLRTLGSKLSHELHTPLAIVRSSLDNLEHESLDDGARVYAERARAGADRLNGILRSMSEASRVERAIAAAEGEDFDLAQLVRGSADAYRDLVEPVRLVLEAPSDPIVLHAAPDLLAQALDKLIDNARSFTPADGTITIRLEPTAEGTVELTVANTGPLLPEKMQDRLFDSLVSVREPTTSHQATHLGLGLFIVRLVAELHHGVARARNLADGSGVEFTLVLRAMPRRRMS